MSNGGIVIPVAIAVQHFSLSLMVGHVKLDMAILILRVVCCVTHYYDTQHNVTHYCDNHHNNKKCYNRSNDA